MSFGLLMDDFERTEYSDGIHGVLGRALIYCSRFESICKSAAILKKIKLQRHVFDSKTCFEKIWQQFRPQSLGGAINSFLPKGEKYSIFENARIARNEIVHEATLGFDRCLDQIGEKNISKDIDSLRSLISAIAAADFLICYLMSLETHEPVPMYPEKYKDDVLKWIFEP